MTKKTLTLYLSIGAMALVGCNQSSPKTLSSMFEDASKGVALSGSVKITTEDGFEDVGTVSASFAPNSFSVLQDGEVGRFSLEAYKDANGNAITYYIDRNNTVQSAPISDGSGAQYSFSYFQNPFIEFSEHQWNGEGNVLSIASDASSINCFTRFVSLLSGYSFTNYETFEITKDSEKITKIHLVSDFETVEYYNCKYEYVLDVDYGTKDSYETAVIQPKETLPYHQTIKDAFSYLLTNAYQCDMRYSIEGNQGGAFLYHGVLTPTLRYFENNGTEEGTFTKTFNGYVKKDDGIHVLQKLPSGKFAYRSGVEFKQDYSGVATEFSDLYSIMYNMTPDIWVAAEFFSVNNDGTYSLDVGQIETFGNNISPYIGAFQLMNSCTLSLDSSNRLSKLVFVGDGLNLTLDYAYGEDINLPFVPSELAVAANIDLFVGTFTGILSGTAITIVVGEDNTVSLNGETGKITNIANTYLDFTCGGHSYYIQEYNGTYELVQDNTTRIKLAIAS